MDADNVPLLSTEGSPNLVSVISWNIAAINNNPFEYWMDPSGCKDPHIAQAEAAYSRLMTEAGNFIDRQREAPADQLVRVKDIMTPAMVDELFQLMEPKGWVGLEETRNYYEEDVAERGIISGVLFDQKIGKKRLCSWSDRYCNSIRCVDDFDEPMTLYRPSVINFSTSNALGDPKTRWKLWKQFMFDTPVRKAAGNDPIMVCDMLQPLKKSKYPDLTVEEEHMSMPLQTLFLAIFDMILFRIVDEAAPGRWLQLKKMVVDASGNKIQRTTQILATHYSHVDVMCICEASANFLEDARNSFGKDYVIPVPMEMDPEKDQNSFLLLHKRIFGDAQPRDITEEVKACFPKDKPLPLSVGDLFAVHLEAAGSAFVLASFHGDTQGLSTIPVLTALSILLASPPYAGCQLIFGMDANAYADAKGGSRLGIDVLGECLAHKGWRSSFGAPPNKAMVTTCAARTFLQPQTNKGNSAATRCTNGDTNPKDHILYVDASAQLVGQPHRDNTGSGRFQTGVTFPSLAFPSDHALIGAVLKLKEF